MFLNIKVLFSLILFITAMPLHGHNSFSEGHKHDAATNAVPSDSLIFHIEEKLKVVNNFLFQELLDSAHIYVDPLIADVSSLDLFESNLGLRVRLAKIYSFDLECESGAALESAFDVIETCKEQENWLILAWAYLLVERVFEFQNKPKQSIVYLEKCLDLVTAYGLEQPYPSLCIRFSRYHELFGGEKESFFYLSEALDASSRLYKSQNEVFSKQKFEDVTLDFATSNTLMGFYYQKLGDKDNAQFYFDEVSRAYQKVNDDFHLLWSYLHLSKMHYEIGDINLALVYSDNCQYLNPDGFQTYGHFGQYLESESLLHRSLVFHKVGQLDSAFHAQRRGYEIALDYERHKDFAIVAKVEAEYTDALKALKIEQQYELLAKDKKLIIGLVFIIITSFILIGLIIYFYQKLRAANLKTRIQSEQLKELDQIKSDFFANISHELRTPLALILGPLSFLLNREISWNNSMIKNQLQVMQRNGENLMNLIEEILDLSKMEFKKLDLYEQSTPLLEYFQKLWNTFIPQFELQDLKYKLDIDISPDLNILLDQNKIAKILNNLLSNAIKFTDDQGEVALKLRVSNSDILIEVSDSGQGIHPIDLPHVFERYYQSKVAENKLRGGSGIGLALVNEYAKLMGGNVFVDSTLGKGSVFYFSFPKKVVQSQVNSDLILEHLSEEGDVYSIGKNYSILVVEDNKDMREFIFQLLKTKYNQVILAKDGEEGLQVLKGGNQKIDLIISDVMMPKVDGLTFLKEVKGNKEWSNIPVIMLTALNTERDKLNALTIGVDDYLTKPFSVPELLIRVQNLLYNYQERLDWRMENAEKEPSASVEQDLGLAKGIMARDKKWIEELKSHIENHSNEERLNVDVLAELVFYSPRQLTRKLKPLTGLSPAKFIKEVRLQKGRRLLEQGDYFSISDVAYSSGFENHATFSIAFKNRFGKSPSNYTKQVGSVNV
jgi:signal transduction histidine kinase/DNA-binding response OmpR family regulator